MKRIVSGFAMVLVVACLARPAAGAEAPEKAAQAAAEPWLALVDDDKYQKSWEQAASLFKERVTEEQWANALKSVRAQTGEFISRKLKSARFTNSLPDAPAGNYVILVYESAFEKFKSATETVVPMKEKDGSWRVSGYFVK